MRFIEPDGMAVYKYEIDTNSSGEWVEEPDNNSVCPPDATKVVIPKPVVAPPKKSPEPENQNKVNVNVSAGMSVVGIEINTDGSAGYKGVTVSNSGIDLVVFAVSQERTNTTVLEPLPGTNATLPVKYEKVVSTMKSGFIIRGARQKTEIYRNSQLVSTSVSSGISVGYKWGVKKGLDIGGEIDIYNKAK